MFIQGGRAVLTAEDIRLLNRLQEGFPVAERPYALLGAELGMDEAEVINRVEQLKQAGYIRRIGPSFNSAKLGYASTLIALAVPPEKIEETAMVINSYQGVTHNYVRTGKYNVWFTLIAAGKEELEKVSQDIGKQTGISEMLVLPATRLYKVNVNLCLPEGRND